MPAPNTYTRQDIAEIHCHSGPAILQTILHLCIAQGARLAEPGEFTLRAFLNGRIDLTQAEAVVDLTTAASSAQGRIGISHLQGRLSERISSLKSLILSVVATLEVAIDYPEEFEEIAHEHDIPGTIEKKILPEIASLIKDYSRAALFRHGARITIAGKPNAGKSSLLNALACQDRAIVTEIPGTTRDTIEVEIEIGGISVCLTDTAGIRQDPDPVESVGIERAARLLSNSDLVLWLLDLSTGISREDIETYQIIEQWMPEKKRRENLLLVFNKGDLIESASPSAKRDCAGRRAEELAVTLLQELREETGCQEEHPYQIISAREQQGLSELEQRICQILTRGNPEPPEAAPNQRQKELIQQAEQACKRALQIIRADNPMEMAMPELAVIEMRDALNALDEITGQTTTEDILHDIFSRFCLGK